LFFNISTNTIRNRLTFFFNLWLIDNLGNLVTHFLGNLPTNRLRGRRWRVLRCWWWRNKARRHRMISLKRKA